MACAGKARRRRALRFAWAGRRGLSARKEEQRGQRAPGRLNRVCSAVVNPLVSKILNGHSALQAVDSNQLRFLG